METTYEYFKSVFMPFAYTNTKYIPDSPYKKNKGIASLIGNDKVYTVQPGGVVEVLSICPYLSITNGTVSGIIKIFSALDPTLSGNTEQRYSGGIVLGLSSPQPATSLHRACASIYANVPVTYEACMYVKTSGDVAELPENMFLFNKKYSGVLQPPDKFWINMIPLYFEKKSHDNLNNSYLPGTNVHYMVRIINTGTSPATVYVNKNSDSTIVENDIISGSGVTTPLTTSPIGFTHYVLERLRDKHCFMVLDNTNSVAVNAKKTEIEADIKNEINELAKNWYDLMKVIPGIDLSKLNNFIIFYLE